MSTQGPAPDGSAYVPAHAAPEEPADEEPAEEEPAEEEPAEEEPGEEEPGEKPSPGRPSDAPGAEGIEPVTPAAPRAHWYRTRSFRPGRGRIPPPPLPPVAPPPLPPPLKPRPYASPPVPRRRGEWRVLIIALIITSVLMVCVCAAGYALFVGRGGALTGGG